MNKYVVGTPGNSPRIIITGDEALALFQVREGEVCFVQDDVPPAPHAISQDGKTLEGAPDPDALDRAWDAVRMTRNALLNHWSWTYRADSPLIASSQAEWLAWARAINRLTITYRTPAEVQWPMLPSLIYEENT